MKVRLVWFVVVFSAESNKTLISDERNWLLARIRAQLNDHDVYAEVKLFVIYQQRICQVLLRHVVLTKHEVWDVFVFLSQQDATALSPSCRLNDESLFARAHG